MSADAENGRRSGAATAALDILLTDAAVGNPASRALREPAGIVRAGAKVAAHPDRLVRRGGAFGRELARVAVGSSDVVPAKGDRRFADPAWQKNWFFRRLAQAYVAAGGAVDGLIDDADLDWRADTTARFVAGNVH
jgi:polyhydroxyalkanoate synthase subunit PhaC